MCSSSRCLSRREALCVWSPVTTDWGISGKYKTSVKEIEGEKCVQKSVWGAHTGMLAFPALAVSQKHPWVSVEQVPPELAVGTVWNRRWWKLCCQVPVQKDRIHSPASESLVTDSHHHGPSGCAWLWLLLRAQEGFPHTSSAPQYQWWPVWEAMNS